MLGFNELGSKSTLFVLLEAFVMIYLVEIKQQEFASIDVLFGRFDVCTVVFLLSANK